MLYLILLSVSVIKLMRVYRIIPTPDSIKFFFVIQEEHFFFFSNFLLTKNKLDKTLKTLIYGTKKKKKNRGYYS